MSRPVHQMLFSRGLCRQCCKPVGEDTRRLAYRKRPPRMCTPCRLKAAEYMARQRAARKAEGACVICGNNREGVDAATTGTATMCRLCADTQNTIHRREGKARRARWQAAGLCAVCGHGRGPGATTTKCRKCSDRVNAQKRRRRAELRDA